MNVLLAALALTVTVETNNSDLSYKERDAEEK